MPDFPIKFLKKEMFSLGMPHARKAKKKKKKAGESKGWVESLPLNNRPQLIRMGKQIENIGCLHNCVMRR